MPNLGALMVMRCIAVAICGAVPSRDADGVGKHPGPVSGAEVVAALPPVLALVRSAERDLPPACIARCQHREKLLHQDRQNRTDNQTTSGCSLACSQQDEGSDGACRNHHRTALAILHQEPARELQDQ